jgi:hypothetical protein
MPAKKKKPVKKLGKKALKQTKGGVSGFSDVVNEKVGLGLTGPNSLTITKS